MEIILINGEKRSGKNYLAELIKNEFKKHNKTFKIMAFADPIKDIISIALNISLDELDEYKNKKTPICINNKEVTNSRKILQDFGTEAMRKYFGESVWVDVFLRKIQNLNCDYILVPDFRFLIEALSSYTIHIINDDVIDTSDKHRSENELKDFKFLYKLNNTNHKITQKDVELLVSRIIKQTTTYPGY